METQVKTADAAETKNETVKDVLPEMDNNYTLLKEETPVTPATVSTLEETNHPPIVPVTEQEQYKAVDSPVLQQQNNTEPKYTAMLVPAKKQIPRISIAPMTPALNDDGRLVFGIIFLLLFLSPFAILVYMGSGSEFSLDLLIWVVGLALLVIGAIIASVFLVYAGWIFLLAAWIYAIVAMVRHSR